jgi:PAS domain S-box-containing protein
VEVERNHPLDASFPAEWTLQNPPSPFPENIPSFAEGAFLDLVSSHINGYFYLTTPDYQTFLSVGRGFWRIWGLVPCDPKQLPEKCLCLVHPDDRPKVLAAMEQRNVTDAALDIKYRIVRNDREERWLHVRTKAVADENHKPMGQLGFAEDITERMQAQISMNSRLHFDEIAKQFEETLGTFTYPLESLSHATRQLVECLGLAGCAIRMASGEDCFTTLASWSADENTTFLPVLKIVEESLQDDSLERTPKVPEQRNKLPCTSTEIHRQLSLRTIHIPIRNGKTLLGVLEVLAHPENLIKPHCLQFLTTTVPRIFGPWLTNYRLHERLVSEQQPNDVPPDQEHYRQARDTFLSRISHEIRTPLHAALGMTNLLFDTSLDGRQSEWVQIIRDSNEELLRKVNRILDFQNISGASPDSGAMSFVLSHLLDETIDLTCSNVKNTNIAIYYAIKDDVQEDLFGNTTRIRQILYNLIENAINFSENRDVMIRVSRASLIGPTCSLLHFAIEDSGAGMSEQQIANALEPFQQIHDSKSKIPSGIGLGLTVSKRLIEFLDGRLWIESSPGRGTVVHFEIPLTHSKLVKATPISGHACSGRNFLIVSSNPNQRDAVSYHIRSAGGSVSFASDWNACDRSLLSSEPEPKTILIDEQLILDLPGALDMAQDNPLLVISAKRIYSDLLRVGRKEYCRIGSPLTRDKLQIGLNKATAKFRNGEVLEDPMSDTRAAEPEPCEVSSFNPLRILVAEDNPVNQRLTQLQLARLGYRADIVCNGLEALQSLQRQTYDVVLMDIEMPEMDGIETTKQIRALIPQHVRPRIIAVTAYDLPADRKRCKDAGMDAFIAKPIDMSELIGHLTQCRPRLPESYHSVRH